MTCDLERNQMNAAWNGYQAALGGTNDVLKQHNLSLYVKIALSYIRCRAIDAEDITARNRVEAAMAVMLGRGGAFAPLKISTIAPLAAAIQALKNSAEGAAALNGLVVAATGLADQVRAASDGGGSTEHD